MIQFFKRIYYALMVQPGNGLTLIGIVLCIVGGVECAVNFVALHFGIILPDFICNSALILSLVAVLMVLPPTVWLHFHKIEINDYFQIISPMLQSGRILIAEKKPKKTKVMGKNCPTITRELAIESQHMSDYLPVGKYQTLTHMAVVKRLRKCPEITFDAEPKPAFIQTLQHVLKTLTCGRCRKCDRKALCSPWNTPARQFYLVRFTVHPQT